MTKDAMSSDTDANGSYSFLFTDEITLLPQNTFIPSFVEQTTVLVDVIQHAGSGSCLDVYWNHLLSSATEWDNIHNTSSNILEGHRMRRRIGQIISSACRYVMVIMARTKKIKIATWSIERQSHTWRFGTLPFSSKQFTVYVIVPEMPVKRWYLSIPDAVHRCAMYCMEEITTIQAIDCLLILDYSVLESLPMMWKNRTVRILSRLGMLL